MAEMKGIKLCGECGNYDYKKHRCRIGCIDDSNAQASFYGDCPLPDVVPKSEYDAVVSAVDNSTNEFLKLHDAYQEQKAEIERLQHILDSYALQYGTVKDQHEVIDKAKTDVAREIFEEIFEALQGEIDEEDKLGRNAWEIGDTAGYHIHQYAEEKLDTLQIALSLYKKKYTEGKYED